MKKLSFEELKKEIGSLDDLIIKFLFKYGAIVAREQVIYDDNDYGVTDRKYQLNVSINSDIAFVFEINAELFTAIYYSKTRDDSMKAVIDQLKGDLYPLNAGSLIFNEYRDILPTLIDLHIKARKATVERVRSIILDFINQKNESDLLKEIYRSYLINCKFREIPI